MPLYDIAINSDDWYITDGVPVNGTTTLLQTINNVISPSIIQISIGLIDTTGIPAGDVITAATIHWYHDSYSSSRGVTKTFYIRMQKADLSGFITIFSGTYVSSGWKSHALTAAELLEINKGGQTQLRFQVQDPGGVLLRASEIRAREYGTDGTYDMYLDITHAPAGPTEVEITKTLDYNIIIPADITKGLEYTVKPTIEITKQLAYLLDLPPTDLNRELTYEVTSQQEVTKQLQYKIVANVDITKGLDYSIIVPNEITKALAYQVRLIIDLNLSLEYAIIIPADIQKQLSYTILDQKAITKTLEYFISVTDEISKPLSYEVLTNIKVTKILSYEIIVQNEITKQLQYTVSPQFSILLNLQYEISPARLITKTLQYTVVATQEAIQLDLTYIVRSIPYCPKDSPYSPKPRICN